MPAPSLCSTARKVCVRNIRTITDIGELPYEIIRPVLLKIENAQQLRHLERNSPHLCGPDAEIWRELIKRDIPNWEKNLREPRNPANWYKEYNRLQQENEKDIAADAEILRNTMAGIAEERAKHTSKVISSKSVPKLPRMGGMRAEKGGRFNPVEKKTNSLTFTSGSKTKILTGKGVIEKARREARELSLFSAKKSILTKPTHLLNSSASQIRAAPRGLVDDYRKPKGYQDMPSNAASTIRAPRKRKASEDEATSPAMNTFSEREQRLRALTSQAGKTTAISPPPSRLQPQPSPLASDNASAVKPGVAYSVPRIKPADEKFKLKPKASVGLFMPPKRRKVA